MHGDSLLMLTTKVVSNKKPPLLSDSESGGSTSLIQTYKYIKKEQIICSIPRYSIRLFIIMMILSQIVFEKNLIKFLADYGQLLEECTEILAYCSLVCFTYDISFKKK